MLVPLATASPFDPASCSWEWGGVPEVDPAPCADPYMSRLAGGGLVAVGFAVVFQFVLLAAVIAVALRMRHA